MNVDPDGRVTFDKSTYDNYCGKGACAGYNPQPMIASALSAARKPSCTRWWSSAFPTASRLDDLLTNPTPRIYFGGLPTGVGGVYFGAIVLDCKMARCNEWPGGAAGSATVLIHELVHYAQGQDGGPLFALFYDVENDPARGARSGTAVCNPF